LLLSSDGYKMKTIDDLFLEVERHIATGLRYDLASLQHDHEDMDPVVLPRLYRQITRLAHQYSTFSRDVTNIFQKTESPTSVPLDLIKTILFGVQVYLYQVNSDRNAKNRPPLEFRKRGVVDYEDHCKEHVLLRQIMENPLGVSTGSFIHGTPGNGKTMAASIYFNEVSACYQRRNNTEIPFKIVDKIIARTSEWSVKCKKAVTKAHSAKEQVERKRREFDTRHDGFTIHYNRNYAVYIEKRNGNRIYSGPDPGTWQLNNKPFNFYGKNEMKKDVNKFNKMCENLKEALDQAEPVIGAFIDEVNGEVTKYASTVLAEDNLSFIEFHLLYRRREDYRDNLSSKEELIREEIRRKRYIFLDEVEHYGDPEKLQFIHGLVEMLYNTRHSGRVVVMVSNSSPEELLQPEKLAELYPNLEPGLVRASGRIYDRLCTLCTPIHVTAQSYRQREQRERLAELG
jgi:hypothetical protein